MINFLTLEDVNSAFVREQLSFFYELNTADISDGEYADVKLDFCIVEHTVTGGNHTFKFEVVNSLCNLYCYCLDAKGDYVPASNVTFDGDIISVVSEGHVRLFLYCSVLNSIVNYHYLDKIPVGLDSFNIYYNDLDKNEEVNVYDLTSKTSETQSIALNNIGVNEFKGISQDTPFYFMVNIIKSNVNLTGTDTVKSGKINKVKLHVAPEFLPGGELIGDYGLNMQVQYNDKLIDVYYDENINDYYFNLDLTGKTDVNSVDLKLLIYENKLINYQQKTMRLKSEFVEVDNFADFTNEILMGNKIISLAGSFDCYNRINITHDLIINGNGNTINLNGYGFNLKEDTVFKMEKVQFNNADTAIIQGLNSKVEINECTFTHCKSTNYNNLGSIIFCDVNIDSLTANDDYITNITNTKFKNNYNCILHGGTLTVDNCKYHNNDLTYMDNNNTGFLYQTDGNATILNSVFDIDYDTDDLCNNNINIGFGQALIHCGETAIINGADMEYLTSDSHLPFFDNPYNNQSHVFAKYYYPAIETCVYTSPVINKEDKSVCYCVTNNDWVFKDNVQVTKADAGKENTNRKIIWED